MKVIRVIHAFKDKIIGEEQKIFRVECFNVFYSHAYMRERNLIWQNQN